MTPVKGQCLCGSIAFEVVETIERVDVCHCNMCRRWVGAAFISADIRHAAGISFQRDDTLTWYESSDWGKRGFCSKCGSSLFFRLKENENFWAVTAGSLDLPPGLNITKEIFVDEKPDYYALEGDQQRLTGPDFLASLQQSSGEGS